jgi:hypothetical protein
MANTANHPNHKTNMNKPTGIEQLVCNDIAARQQKGITKYGCTVKDSLDDMLQHAYEECLDLCVYLKAEIGRRNQPKPKAVDIEALMAQLIKANQLKQEESIKNVCPTQREMNVYSKLDKVISRKVPKGYTMRREGTSVRLVDPSGKDVHQWSPARLKSVSGPRTDRKERSGRAWLVVGPHTLEGPMNGAPHMPECRDNPKPEPEPKPKPEPAPVTQRISPDGLLSANDMLVFVWPDPASRPSLRWIRGLQAKRAIPFIKMGRLTFFEPARVIAALRKFEVTCH